MSNWIKSERFSNGLQVLHRVARTEKIGEVEVTVQGPGGNSLRQFSELFPQGHPYHRDDDKLVVLKERIPYIEQMIKLLPSV